MMIDEQRSTLEDVWDSVGLAAILRGLADIAYEKEEHLAVNWQDKHTARDWRITAVNLENAANLKWVGNCPLA